MVFSKEKLPVRIFKFLFPVIYGVSFYSWILISERILRSLTYPNHVAYFFFLPIVILETYITYRLLDENKIIRIKKDLKLFETHITIYQFFSEFLFIAHLLLNYVIRLFFQFFVFFLWVIFPLSPIPGLAWMSPMSPYILQCLGLSIFARPLNSLIMLIPSGILYFSLWGRRRIGRIFFSVILLIVFSLSAYILFYFDLAGGQSKEEVIAQPGVSIILSFDNLDCVRHCPAKFLSPYRFPRCLQGDWKKGKLYLSFGSIWPHPLPCSPLIACDLDGKNMQSILFSGFCVKSVDRTFREFQLDPQVKDFYISCMNASYKIYRVDQSSLSVVEEITFDFLRPELKDYNLYDIVSNQENNRLFFATAQPPTVTKINLIEKTTTVLNLTKMGITEFGSMVHVLRYDKKLNIIYAVVITRDKGGLLMEIDPENMMIIRMFSLPGVCGTTLELDSKNNEILVGMGWGQPILVVDRKTFKVKYSIPTPPFSFIRRFDINSESGLLYVVDYLRGYLYIIKKGSGEIVKAYKVGNKPLGMIQNGSTVYIASVLGIIKIEVPNLPLDYSIE